jgi:hypothetical protein
MLKVQEYKDYDHYVEAQTGANKRKITWQFKKEDHVKWIKERKLGAKNIICHGTRNGGEQRFFQKYWPDAYVIGTEISETATQFEMTVQHDFAIPKTEWIGKFDILYSNSFDHSIDPPKTIETWKKQISYDGKLFIEWSDYYNAKSTLSDPVSGTTQEFISFLESHNVVIEEFNKKFGLLMCNVR